MLEPLTITNVKIPGVGQQVRPSTVALLMGLTALGQLGVNPALPALPAIGSALDIERRHRARSFELSSGPGWRATGGRAAL